MTSDRALSFTSLIAIICLALSAQRASADSECAAGNLSTILGTTCDIGSLQFSFTQFSGESYAHQYVGNSESLLYSYLWSADQFTFTPVTDGFTVSLLNQATISLTAPVVSQGSAEAFDFADLSFTLTDLTGNVVGVTTAGPISSVGNYNGGGNASAAIFGDVINYPGDAVSYALQEDDGNPNNFGDSSGPPFASGSGDLQFLTLDAQTPDGSAFWGGSSTMTFATVAATSATPEPTSLTLLGSGLTLLAAAIRRRGGRS